MPKGPKGEKRPADVIGNAVRVMEIATGQREEEYDAADECFSAISATNDHPKHSKKRKTVK